MGQLVWLGSDIEDRVDGVDHLAVEAVEHPLLHNDTANTARQSAMDRQAANGGLGEYYSEADTRIPSWLIAGDVEAAGRLCGLDAAALVSGAADTDVAGS